MDDQRAFFMENVAYGGLKEDPEIIRYLESIRPQLKELITKTSMFSFKRPGETVFANKWPTELSLYSKDGHLYSIDLMYDASVDWYIANRSLELLPTGELRIIDTGLPAPNK